MYNPFSQFLTCNHSSSARLFRSGSLALALTLVFSVISPTAQAVTPAPDGGYPNQNTAEGTGALFSLTIGNDNTASGFEALHNNTEGCCNTANGSQALRNNTTGLFNTATGIQALFHNTDFGANTADGAFALFSNTGGGANTATGFDALTNNTTGSNNTANGAQALLGNRTGSNNTATGFSALRNATGSNNTANGVQALLGNTTGSNNTANGISALRYNNIGNNNTATGSQALFSNTSGNLNTAIGVNALLHNDTGTKNTGVGTSALSANAGGTNNVASGNGALAHNTTGSFNTALGSNAGSALTTGSNNIDIGAVGVVAESNTMRLGTGKLTATFIAGVRGVTTRNANAVPVVIDSAGQIGTISSSQRFKDHIAPMGEVSEALLALKPVTFHYKSDKQNTAQFGLIAEDVAKVNPSLVVRDDDGEVYTVRYEAVNVMLLNEFLKEHGQVQQLKATVAQQQKQIEALVAGLQKISGAVELNKPAPTQVADNR
jgi:Chaperone of endosialidase